MTASNDAKNAERTRRAGGAGSARGAEMRRGEFCRSARGGDKAILEALIFASPDR